MRLQRAWFSQEAVNEGHPSHIYKTVDGDEVECTAVTDRSEADVAWREFYAWKDAVFVGEVSEYVRQGKPRNDNLWQV